MGFRYGWAISPFGPYLYILTFKMGRDLVLPQVGIPDLVDSTRKALLSLRNGWVIEKGEVRGGRRRGNGNWGSHVK